MSKKAFDFDVIFEDPHLIVLSKHAGLLSQGEATGDINLVDQLREYFGRHYVGLIHRLDRNTSGIMIIAKRTKSAQRLSEALKKGQVDRSYLSLHDGEFPQARTLKHYLKKNSHNKVQCYDDPAPLTKEAIMTLSPLAHSEASSATLCYVELQTGRPHQIRAQSHHIGHPLLGDSKYAAKGSGQRFHRPALHSFKLEFPHPKTQEPMTFKAPLPSDMQNLLKELKLNENLDRKLSSL